MKEVIVVLRPGMDVAVYKSFKAACKDNNLHYRYLKGMPFPIIKDGCTVYKKEILG